MPEQEQLLLVAWPKVGMASAGEPTTWNSVSRNNMGDVELSKQRVGEEKPKVENENEEVESEEHEERAAMNKCPTASSQSTTNAAQGTPASAMPCVIRKDVTWPSRGQQGQFRKRYFFTVTAKWLSDDWIL